MLNFLPLAVVLHTLCEIAFSTECFHARSALPTIRDCEDLTDAIAFLSRLPNENNVTTWGRRLPTGPYIQSLPQDYSIVGRGSFANT